MAKTLALLWVVSLPGLLSATCSSNQSPNGISTLQHESRTEGGERNCMNGWCGEDGTCNCNPCWSGSTCQEYVDRFSPRFLAEEPFFRVVKGSERDAGTEVPLFRIESSDDDLGLTCQLGQVGPAATCPCATPRYKVVGPSRALFRADAETGDVFIKSGYSLQQGKHYLITLQVAALEMNASGYHPWSEEVRATLYVQSSKQAWKLAGSSEDEAMGSSSSSSSSLSLPTDLSHKSTTTASLSPLSHHQLRSVEEEPDGTYYDLPSRWTSLYTRSKRNATSSGMKKASAAGPLGPRTLPQRVIYGLPW